MRTLTLSLLVTALVVSIPLRLAHADDVVEPPAEQLSREVSKDTFPLHSVSVEAIELTQEPEVPGQFILPLLVTNNSREPIELRGVSVRFLVSPGTFENADGEGPLCQIAQGQIEPRSTRIAHCLFEPIVKLDTALGLFDMAIHWRTLTLSPGKFQLLAVAHFQRTVDDASQVHYARSIISLPLRPAIWQIVMGAGFGALLLALFLGWSDDNAKGDGKPSQRSHKRFIQNLLASWAVGWLSASIIIFMTHRMRDAGFPIAITVNDFYGGIVLGLFGFLFSRALRERFITKQAQDASSVRAPTAAPAPVPVPSSQPGPTSNPERAADTALPPTPEPEHQDPGHAR